MEQKIEETKRAILDKLVNWLERNTIPDKKEIIFPHEHVDNGYYAPTTDGGEMCILSVGLHSVFHEQLIINRDIIECDPYKWDFYDVEILYLSTLNVAGVSTESAIEELKDPLEKLFKWIVSEIKKSGKPEFEIKENNSILWHSPNGDVILDEKYDWMYSESGEPLLPDPRPEDVNCLMSGAENPLVVWTDAWRASQEGL